MRLKPSEIYDVTGKMHTVFCKAAAAAAKLENDEKCRAGEAFVAAVKRESDKNRKIVDEAAAAIRAAEREAEKKRREDEAAAIRAADEKRRADEAAALVERVTRDLARQTAVEPAADEKKPTDDERLVIAKWLGALHTYRQAMEKSRSNAYTFSELLAAYRELREFSEYTVAYRNFNALPTPCKAFVQRTVVTRAASERTNYFLSKEIWSGLDKPGSSDDRMSSQMFPFLYIGPASRAHGNARDPRYFEPDRVADRAINRKREHFGWLIARQRERDIPRLTRPVRIAWDANRNGYCGY